MKGKKTRARTCTNTHIAKREEGCFSRRVASVRTSLDLTRSHLFSCSGQVLPGCTQSCPAPDISGPRNKVREQGTSFQCRRSHLQTWRAHLAWAAAAPVLPRPAWTPPSGLLGPAGVPAAAASRGSRAQTLRGGPRDQESETCCFQGLRNGSAPGSVAELEKRPRKVLVADSGA